MPTFKDVTILDDKGNVDPTQADVILHFDNDADEQVRWISNGPTDTVYVVFYTKKHTPFKKAVFPILPGGAGVPSDKIQKKVGDTYKYAVVGTQGSNDPTVIINR